MEHSSTPPAPPAPAEAPATASALFVATDLDHFEAPEPSVFADDVTISGRCYRRLDPRYYAWLRRQTAAAKRALDVGRLSAAAFETIRKAFMAVHAWAVARFGEAALVTAARTFDPKGYEPPREDDEDGFLGVPARVSPRGPTDGRSSHRHPAEGTWTFTELVSADAVATVDAIRDEALALGWSLDALYQNRGNIAFPCGREWGVVAFLGGGARIAAVTRAAIPLAHARGATSRLPNPDVPQPWCRRTSAAPPAPALATP